VSLLVPRGWARRSAALALTSSIGVVGWAAAPAGGADEPPSPCALLTKVTWSDPNVWALQRLSPVRMHALGTGAGQVVALIGMEVDAGNSQLTDAVAPLVRVGKDPSPKRLDCSGTGTFLAGLIVARPDPANTTPVAGLAPGVRLVPITIGDAPARQQAIPTPAQLAQAFDAALTAHATVICVTTAATEDSPALEAAVRRALAADVVVVAAGATQSSVGQAPGPTFPTSYPEVLSVVGVDEFDQPVTGSDHGSYTDLAAPATQLWSTGPVPAGYTGYSHIALESMPTAGAAYVAATAALVREAYPRASGAEVSDRILATTDVAGGQAWGVVDPLRAVTEVLTPQGDRIVDHPKNVAPMPVLDGVSTQTRLRAAAAVAAGVAATAAALALTAAGRRGRRWRRQAGEGRARPVSHT
jgi:membrane-anchored mycosin MYCP